MGTELTCSKTTERMPPLSNQLNFPSCPFCGAEAEFEYDDWNSETGEGDDGIGWLKCTNPKCGVGFHDDYDSALAKWCMRIA